MEAEITSWKAATFAFMIISGFLLYLYNSKNW